MIFCSPGASVSTATPPVPFSGESDSTYVSSTLRAVAPGFVRTSSVV